jgi:hypothetical protein
LIEAAGGRNIFGPLPFAPGHAEMCAEHPAWSAFDGNQILACGGIHRDFETCGTAWSLLLPSTARHMTGLTRLSRRVFDASPLVRIQAHASPTFKPAMRWLAMLGFKYEGTMRKFSPSGSDVLLFARVR